MVHLSNTKLYTREQVAKNLKRHPELVGKWLRSGFIRAKKVYGVWLVPQAELDRMKTIPVQRRRRVQPSTAKKRR